jgi:O-antigen/teichoic acid export membrane protein
VLGLVRQFFALSALQAVIGTVTGVIAARTLGPAGRGELAAIIVPLSMAPYALAFGLPTFASRSVAGGRDISSVLGTAGGLAFAIGCIAILPCVVFVAALADGSHGVHTVLVVGFAALPLTLAANILADAGLGLQRWRSVVAQRLIPMCTVLMGYIVLVAVGAFTPASAGAFVLAGGMLSVLPFVPIAAAAWPLRFRAAVARDALALGARAVPITLSQLLNHRLDQFLMVALVSRRELGLYAVAVTISSISGMLAGAMNTVLYPKVAAGEDIDVARALRRGLFAVLCVCAASAVAAPLLLPVVFGRAFTDAVPMLLILLAASVPLAGVTILSGVLAAGRRILQAGVSEIVALAVTVGGLLLLLPPLGGVGAAIVSLGAYSVNFAWLLAIARRDHGGRLSDYLVIRAEDVRELYTRARAAVTIARGVTARRQP